MRIDKFLWAVRIYKTRSLATIAIKAGKIQVNQQDSKPSYEIKVNDEVKVRKGAYRYAYKVIAIPSARLSGKLVPEYIVEITSEEDKQRNTSLQQARKDNVFPDYNNAPKSNKRMLRDWKNKLKGLND